MAKKPNVTYLLGAGASYNSIPIVQDLYNQLSLFNGKLRSATMSGMASQLVSNEELKKELIEINEDILLGIDRFDTIDGYAKQLWDNRKERKLVKLKAAISYYFTIRQLVANGTFQIGANILARRLDPRYYKLISKFVSRGPKGPELAPNVNFITWNYDFQIELALMDSHDYKSPVDVFQNFGVIPNPTGALLKDGQIVHLNGIAGAYTITDKRAPYHFLDRHHKEDFEHVAEECLFIFDSLRGQSITFDEMLSFAWEKTKFSEAAIERAKQIMRQTEVLVVIGYSFPDYNRETDKILFNYLNDLHLKGIYYQDPFAPQLDLKHLFGLNHVAIRNITDTRSFIVPAEY